MKTIRILCLSFGGMYLLMALGVVFTNMSRHFIPGSMMINPQQDHIKDLIYAVQRQYVPYLVAGGIILLLIGWQIKRMYAVFPYLMVLLLAGVVTGLWYYYHAAQPLYGALYREMSAPTTYMPGLLATFVRRNISGILETQIASLIFPLPVILFCYLRELRQPLERKSEARWT